MKEQENVQLDFIREASFARLNVRKGLVNRADVVWGEAEGFPYSWS